MNSFFRVPFVCVVVVLVFLISAAVDAALHAHHHSPARGQATASTGSFFTELFKTYTPRRVCMNEEQAVIWLHLITDSVISIAYFTIPMALLRFVRRRKDLAFNWMFVCFAVFILACGLTHVMNVVAIWTTPYRVDGMIKLVTAAASIGTAIALWRLVPLALLLPSPAQLRRANELLEAEVVERKHAEEQLRSARDDLEARVRARTAELSEANASERAARAEAERASRLKDEFLSTMSHELRTPLNAILGWSHLAQREPGLSKEAAQGLAVIERNARSQAQIIDDLLDMSRIISGKMRLEVQPVDLPQIVAEIAETMRPTVDAKGVSLRTIVDPLHGVLLKGDPNRLRQILWNLASNAIKFTPSGGQIEISLRRSASKIEIRVTDSGEGIDAAFLPFVFDRFRQADSSSTRRHGGLGLGLSIVKHLCELHGGDVRAESAGLGRGSTFTVTLPMASSTAAHGSDQAEDTARSASTGNSPEEHIDLQGVKALVVDDEADARTLVQRVLESGNARVMAAGSAEEALELLSGNRFDVLVSDIGMPEQNGYALIEMVRRRSPETGGSIPAIALTAYARGEDRSRALLAGFQMHIAKPIDPYELLKTVARAAGRLRGNHKTGD